MKALTVLLAVAVTSATIAHADSPNKRADKLNQDGKDLFKDGRYDDAIVKFKQAIVLRPDPRFFFNLCFAENVLEKYPEALENCRQGRRHNPPADLTEKLDKLIAELELRVPGAAPAPAPAPAPGPAPVAAPAVYPPPAGPAFMQASKRHVYLWSLGAEFGVIQNLSMGKADNVELYGDMGGQLRLMGSIKFGVRSRFGARAYIDMARIPGESMLTLPGGRGISTENDLLIVDLGVGVICDINILKRLVWTPGIAIQATALQPEANRQDPLSAAGFRFDSSFAFLLGRRGQHALSLSPSFTVLSRASGADGDGGPVAFGLDEPGTFFTVTVGYSIRFDTLFGARPILSLE